MNSPDVTDTTEAVSHDGVGRWMDTSVVCVQIATSSSVPASEFDFLRDPGDDDDEVKFKVT